MTMTAPFSEQLSEQWLLERTYHAQLRNGRELSVPDLTLAMKQLSDFSVWKAWFASDASTILGGSAASTITFLVPCLQFPYTTHNTVIAADGYVHEYADSAGAIQGFQTLPPREASSGSRVQTIFPQFCYYHEVTCPSGIYRIEFFGPRMDERGYAAEEAA